MDLAYIFVAKYADTAEQSLFTAVGGGITLIKGEHLPVKMSSLAVVAGLRFTPDECGQRHEVLVQLVEPDGVPAQLDPVVLTITPQARDVPGMPTDIPCIVGIMNASFARQGEYTFRLFVGDRLVGAASFRVHVVGQPPQVQSQEARV